jgi:HEAT repeat protein
VIACMHPQGEQDGDEDEDERLDTLTLSSAVAAKLRVLDISGCDELRSIDVVRSCVQLRCLWMPCCGNVSDLSPLAACSETLEELWMADNGRSVKSLAPLKACTRLRKLDLSDCHDELRDQVADLRLACTQLADLASVEVEGLVHDLQPNMSPDMLTNAADVLRDMSNAGGHEAKAAIAAAGAIPALVHLLASDSPEVRAYVAQALGSLARGHPQSQAAIAAAGAIPGLVQLLRPASTTDPLVQRAAAGALGDLAAEHTPNQSAIAAAGAVPLLVQLQGSTDAEVRANATAALLHLAAFRA